MRIALLVVVASCTVPSFDLSPCPSGQEQCGLAGTPGTFALGQEPSGYRGSYQAQPPNEALVGNPRIAVRSWDGHGFHGDVTDAHGTHTVAFTFTFGGPTP